MFRWNIAKSAEAVFSRYAVKRVCKFLLKKKLGQFIHGDIDLGQLDVQLAAGMLRLTDLALNVDFLNSKLGQSSIFWVREGSIRSLSVNMPWNGKGCEVEVDELELVLCSCCNDRLPKVDGASDSNQDGYKGHGKREDEHDMIDKTSAASVNVHEGVKTVAKMVKWLLTSFNIRIKNVIVAFETSVEIDEGKEGHHESLVLRVAEIECGTCISEDQNLTDGAKAVDFMGISHLTNFLKFKGAVVELIQVNGDDNQTSPASAQAAVSACGLSSVSKAVLTGERGGFSGSLKLSIPWKNGALDIHKVDAEVNVDPLTVNLRPSTLNWFLVTWEILQNCKEKVDNVCHMSADMIFPDLTSHCFSSVLPSAMQSEKKWIPENQSSIDHNVPLKEEIITDAILPESCLISDWVPFTAGKCENLGIEEADLGASVDQFFECFDGMRSSHSALGSSGMWSWTCSVFSAVTAASNLATGSLNISAEQQNVQTNLKITLEKVSANFSFVDEDQLTHHCPDQEKIYTDPNIHHVQSRWQDIVLVVQVHSQEWKLEATVNHIALDDILNLKGDPADFSLNDHEKGASHQTVVIKHLQDEVLNTLPTSTMFSKASNVEVSDASKSVEVPSKQAPYSLFREERCALNSNIVKATLFETSGASHCLFAVSSKSSDGCLRGRTYFSLRLPPFVFWVNFDLVNMVLDSLRKLAHPSGENDAGNDLSFDTLEEKHDTSACTSWTGSLQGNIYLPHARIILCFPFKNDEGFRSYTSWNQFLALDFSSQPNSKKLRVEGSTFFQEQTSRKNDLFALLHLNVSNLDIFLVSKAVSDDCGSSCTELETQRFCAHRILSFGNGIDWVRLISLRWHENAVTGAWIVKSAKLLATSNDPVTKLSSATTGYEFASASTRKDMEDLSSQKRKELTLSSKCCLHICLSSVVVTLCRSHYLSLLCLLNQVMDDMAGVGNKKASDNEGKTVYQTSVFLECGPVEIHMELDQGDCPKSSLGRELPGSWHKLRLEIKKLQLLSISDIGAINGAHFLWISHCEGRLWGSITTMADQEFLLISCSNSSSGRGDGEGSNMLSCSPAGFDFVHMWEPESFQNLLSITMKCGTIIAPGGRLDWMDKMSSLFSLPSVETSEAADLNSAQGNSQRTSFVLKLVDGALSYEPYLGKPDTNREYISSASGSSASADEIACDPYVACLLAASSLTLSNSTIPGTFDSEYSIRFQDVGLLLHSISKRENALGGYSVGQLRELGYVKVAGEALVDANLRISYDNDISWILKCSKSQIVLNTCHDTAFGLIRLASQIQQLFAPDMAESIVHLQNRWNSVQLAQGRDDVKGETETSRDCFPETPDEQQLRPDSEGKSGLVGLMDEICEDAFLVCGNGVSSFDGSKVNASVHRNLQDEGPGSSVAFSEKIWESGHTSSLHNTELIEGHYLSGLRSLSELTIHSHFSEDVPRSKLVSRGNGNYQRDNSGWYGRTSLRFMEDYVSDWNGCAISKQPVEGQNNIKICDGSKRYKGCLVLNNIEVKWRMYAGSDWPELGRTVQPCGDVCGRDGSVCLELALSNMNIQYDIFPDGDISVSKLCVSVHDFRLFDKSRYAPWKLVLGYYHSKERPRKSSSKAFKLDLEAVRPDPTTPLEEYRLRIGFLPILLHLHQSQLDFLIAFFGGKYSPADQSQSCSQGSASGSSDVISGKADDLRGVRIADEALLPFFQKFDIWPIIVRVDYRPSRVDLAALSGGKYVELVNLVPWKGVELQLKHVQAAGVYGWSNVCETAIGEWLEDISQNQIHKLLQGLPAIRSFVAVGSGAAKFVSLPVKSYRKDHRLVKGLQRGTIAFLRSISVEALGLGLHLAAGAHEILLHAECILTRIQPSVPQPIRSKLKKNLRSDQPEDAQHGLQQAYESLSDGLEKTASALIHTPMKTYQRGGGAGSALVTAVRGAPAAAIAPASAAAQALHHALLGVRNSLDPEQRKESVNKYLGPSDS